MLSDILKAIGCQVIHATDDDGLLITQAAVDSCCLRHWSTDFAMLSLQIWMPDTLFQARGSINARV